MTERPKNNQVYFFSIICRLDKENGRDYSPDDISSRLLDVGCDDWIFQLEKGEKKGKLHYQVFAHTLERLRPRALQKRLGEDTIWGVERCSNSGKEALRSYCMKPHTRVNGPWGKKPIYLMRDLICMENPFPWQKTLLKWITSPPDDRTIIYIYNQKGNVGKSKFAKYCCLKLKIAKCIPLGTSTQIKANVIAQGASRCYMVDCPRTRGKAESLDDLFSAIEEIKDGWVKTAMYGKHKELHMEPPHVICFSNWKAPVGLMSNDMWKIFTIDDEKRLVSYVPEVSQGELDDSVPTVVSFDFILDS